MQKYFQGTISAILVTAALALPAAAASGYTLFGDASLVNPGNNSQTAAQATSTGASAFGGIDFTVPSGITVANIATLSTDYRFTTGSCGLGSPRFQVNVVTPGGTKNLFIYLGPAPSYSGCAANVWANTGNLADSANLVDASQLGGGFYESFAAVIAAFGSDSVSGIQLVIDGPNQTAQFDNTVINGTTYTYESTNVNSCKKSGWQLFGLIPELLRNQGDCVSFFATGGRNQ